MKKEQQYIIGERIRAVRKALKLKQPKFGEPLGFSSSAISNLERGTKAPYNSILKLIHLTYNVNMDYLLHGTEPMFLENNSWESRYQKLSSRAQDRLEDLTDYLIELERSGKQG